MRWPIRSQLLLPVLLLLLGIAGISLTTGLAAARQARSQIENRLRTAARFFAEESTFPLSSNVLPWLRSLSGAEYLLVPADRPRLTTLDLDPATLDLPVQVAEDWHSLHLGTPVRLRQQTYLCGAIRLGRGPNAGDTLYILYPESQWRDARWQAIWPSLVLGVSLGAASLALVLLQAGQLGRRIRELERRTRLIAGGDFSPMPLPGRDDEIRDLTRSVNEMAQQLAQLQKTVRQTERLRLLGQVSGGLAHQMRNGLTGAKLAVQLHLRGADPEEDNSALEVALRQLTLLETHVKRFLDIGRGGPVRREPCDLVALVNEAVGLVEPQCRHAGTSLSWRPTGQRCVVLGDPGQLAGALFNLIGNAIDAAGPGGQVEVRLGCEGGEILLDVIDTGPGPPDEIAERLFEPFVTGKPEGVGLGLAMARQVVETHSGQIHWTREEGRTRFRITLPARVE